MRDGHLDLPIHVKTTVVAIDVFHELKQMKHLVHRLTYYLDVPNITYILGLIFSEYGYVASNGYYSIVDHKANKPIGSKRLSNYLREIIIRDTGTESDFDNGFDIIINKLAEIINKIIRDTYETIFTNNPDILYVTNIILPEPEENPNFYLTPVILFLKAYVQVFTK